MHQKLEAVCVALDKLAESIVNVWGDDRTYNEAFGWSGPALNRHELASVAYALASDIRETQADTIPEAMTGFINDLPRRINVLQTSTVPQFPGGNMGQAIPAYLATLQFVRVQLLPALGWVAIPDEKLLPHKLLRRARAASSQL